MFTRPVRLPLALALAVAAWPAPAPAQVLYTIRDLGTLNGHDQSGGSSINASGQVTGYSKLSSDDNTQRAFRTTATSQLIDLGTLGGYTEGNGINASGQVTGRSFVYSTLPSPIHAFRTTATGLVSDPGADLGTLPGDTISTGYGINTSGQVTGMSLLAGSGVSHAVRTTATGRISDPGADLGTLPGFTGSLGAGINDSGQVTGWSTLLAGNTVVTHAFRTTAAGLVSDAGADLGTLGGTSSDGRAINAAGQVTGQSQIAGNSAYHAFRTTATGLISDPGTDLGTLPGFTNSIGSGVNALGVVVGQSYNGDTLITAHAFIYDTRLRDLNDLIPAGSGWLLLGASGINDLGQITGGGFINGQRHAFLLTPVPEPSALALAGCAAAGGWIIRRRRVGRVNV
jgi:probable HAF family extracellular repeat protein